jgi:hypothetical protein
MRITWTLGNGRDATASRNVVQAARDERNAAEKGAKGSLEARTGAPSSRIGVFQTVDLAQCRAGEH